MSDSPTTEPEKPKLTPANKNPWYVLATIHGEQEGDSIDEELAAKNRETWNRYYSEALTDEQKANLLKRHLRLVADDLVPLYEETKLWLLKTFCDRIGDNGAKLPTPSVVINFSGTHFENLVNFSGFIFLQPAFFDASTFKKTADFNFTYFLKGFSFLSCQFNSDLHFRNSKSIGLSIFNASTFNGQCFFEHSKFLENTIFESTVFKGAAWFMHAEFKGYVWILNSNFSARTSFASSKFITHVPDFRGASLHEATEWHGASWPPVPVEKEACYQQVYCYERLKQEMERLKKHEEELAFFAREMRARRGVMKKGSFAWAMNRLYELLSNYGQDAAGPLWGLFVTFCYGALVLMIMASKDRSLLPYGTAHLLSLGNMIGFVPIKDDMLDEGVLKNLSDWQHGVGIVQALLSLLFLFLLGLRIRNMFRLR
jgi:hypothetical protein